MKYPMHTTHQPHPPAPGHAPADARLSTRHLADWRAFAAAAGAGLAATSAADASIIYNNPNVDVQITTARNNSNVRATAKFTIGGFGETAVIGRGSILTAHLTKWNYASVNGAGPKIFVHYSDSSVQPPAVKFAAGSLVGGQYAQPPAVLRHGFPAGHSGDFTSNKTGIAGFVLPNGDLGWVKVEVIDRNNDGFPDELRIGSDAYNNVPGAPILAGGGEPMAAPEPGTKALALLALGSAGVLAWRKRRTAARTGDPAALTSPDAARILSA